MDAFNIFFFMFYVLTDQYLPFLYFFLTCSTTNIPPYTNFEKLGHQKKWLRLVVKGPTMHLYTAVYLYVHRG